MNAQALSVEGAEHSEHGVFKEIAKGERLVFTHLWDNSDGKVRPETIATVTFTAHDGNTELTFQQAGFASAASRDSHKEGWSSALELLTEYLAGLRTDQEHSAYLRNAWSKSRIRSSGSSKPT